MVVLLVMGAAGAAGGLLLVTRSSRTADLQSSLTAYLGGDCRGTVSQYTSGTRRVLLGSPPSPSAQQRTAVEQCRSVLDVRGTAAAKLTAYAKLARTFGDSPTRASLRREIASVTKHSDVVARSVTGATCVSVLTLRFYDLLPKQESTLPQLYLACGRILTATRQTAAKVNAISLYRAVRVGYPRHPLLTSAVAAEAKLRNELIAQRGNDFGDYTPPRTGNGSRSRLVVSNDAPATLIISLVGSTQARVIEMPPCAACVVQRTTDYTCKRSTAKQTLVLPRGRYAISYELVRPGVQYSPSIGRMNLSQGGAYKDCNYIYNPDQKAPA